MGKGKNYFGITNVHVAPITNEDTMTYGSIMAIFGATKLDMSSQAKGEDTYADDGPWGRTESDPGFDGTLSIRDDASDEEVRKFFSDASGYQVYSNGNIEMRSDKDKVPFAFGCEQEGNQGGGKRRWLYKCFLGKPSISQETTTDSQTGVVIEYPIRAIPVLQPTAGTRSSGRVAHHGDTNYATFFESVPFDTEVPNSEG